MLSSIKPNWFAAVMGTGIVANAAILLPVREPLLGAVAIGFWGLAAALLVTLAGLACGQALRHRAIALSHHQQLGVAPFYGTVSMALLTVAAGSLLAGKQVIGESAAVTVAALLWSLGTLIGLLCAVVVPYLLFTRHRPKLSDAYATWLLPIVPPMVSASTGVGLIKHIADHAARADFVYASYAMFGISIAMSMIVIAILWARLALHGVGESHMTPTLWIVLGPLGQSVTAALLLGRAAGSAVPAEAASAMRGFGIIYGITIWGFAMAWLLIAMIATIRTAREHLPFTPTWWSFTFPLGTVVTGTSELASVAGIAALRPVAVALYVGLLVAWTLVTAVTLQRHAPGLVGNVRFRRTLVAGTL